MLRQEKAVLWAAWVPQLVPDVSFAAPQQEDALYRLPFEERREDLVKVVETARE